MQSITEYAALVKATRKAQKDYFNGGRTPFLLNQAKALERRLDEETEKIINPATAPVSDRQTKMF